MRRDYFKPLNGINLNRGFANKIKPLIETINNIWADYATIRNYIRLNINSMRNCQGKLVFKMAARLD
jgi:hypothetical protein